MSVEIRLAEEKDYEQCVRLLGVLKASTGGEGNATEKPTEIKRTVYNDMIKGDRGLVLVAEENGKLLGMSSISFNLALRYEQSYCQLEELVVDSSARGKNVGGPQRSFLSRRSQQQALRAGNKTAHIAELD